MSDEWSGWLPVLPDKTPVGDDGVTDDERRAYAAEWRETGARKPGAAELRRITSGLPKSVWADPVQPTFCQQHGRHVWSPLKPRCVLCGERP